MAASAKPHSRPRRRGPRDPARPDRQGGPKLILGQALPRGPGDPRPSSALQGPRWPTAPTPPASAMESCFPGLQGQVQAHCPHWTLPATQPWPPRVSVRSRSEQHFRVQTAGVPTGPQPAGPRRQEVWALLSPVPTGSRRRTGHTRRMHKGNTRFCLFPLSSLLLFKSCVHMQRAQDPEYRDTQ